MEKGGTQNELRLDNVHIKVGDPFTYNIVSGSGEGSPTHKAVSSHPILVFKSACMSQSAYTAFAYTSSITVNTQHPLNSILVFLLQIIILVIFVQVTSLHSVSARLW